MITPELSSADFAVMSTIWMASAVDNKHIRITVGLVYLAFSYVRATQQ